MGVSNDADLLTELWESANVITFEHICVALSVDFGRGGERCRLTLQAAEATMALVPALPVVR